MAFIEPMHRNKPNINYLLIAVYVDSIAQKQNWVNDCTTITKSNACIAISLNRLNTSSFLNLNCTHFQIKYIARWLQISNDICKSPTIAEKGIFTIFFFSWWWCRWWFYWCWSRLCWSVSLVRSANSKDHALSCEEINTASIVVFVQLAITYLSTETTTSHVL